MRYKVENIELGNRIKQIYFENFDALYENFNENLYNHGNKTVSKNPQEYFIDFHETPESIKGYVKAGYTKDIDRIVKAAKEFKLFGKMQSNMTLLTETYYSEEGGEIDVERACLDMPDHFIHDLETEEILRGSGFQTIIVNLTASWSIKEESLAYKGLILASLIYALEQRNIRCRVILRLVTEKSYTQIIDVVMKDFGERLNINKLNLSIGTAFWWRYFLLTTLESKLLPFSDSKEFVNGSYGTVRDYVGDIKDNKVIYIPMISTNDKSVIENMLRKKFEHILRKDKLNETV